MLQNQLAPSLVPSCNPRCPRKAPWSWQGRNALLSRPWGNDPAPPETGSVLREETETARPPLTVLTALSLRRSGISDLLGLFALLTMGLEGGRPARPLPTTLPLALREGIRSSFSSPSPALVGLRLGCRGTGEGPPGGRERGHSQGGRPAQSQWP